MARADFEIAILEIRYEHYTNEVRRTITQLVCDHRCKDTSDTVLDGLWYSCRQEMKFIIDALGNNISSVAQIDEQIPTEARETIRTYIDQARNYEAELADMKDETLREIFRATVVPVHQAKREQRAKKAIDNDDWAFFNLPDADADFIEWRDRFLHPAQAVALSFGKDPNVVKPESLEPYRRVGRSPFREAFKNRLDLIEAAVAAKELIAPMTIGDLDRWAIGRGIDLPAALTGKNQGVTEGDAAFWKAKYDAAQSEVVELRRGIDDLPPKSKGSIYRLVLGMAIARFEHRTDQRSSATSAIREDLEAIGIALKDDAIREHLSNAAVELDFEWKTPRRWRGIRVKES